MPAHRAPRWTAGELAVLRTRYADGGAETCAALLPSRSWGAIYVMANKLGIRRPPAATNATAPKPKLQGHDLEEALRLREAEGWAYVRIAMRFGISESSASNAILIAQCARQGFRPAERDDKGRLTAEGISRIRYALRKGLKPVDIQLRLGVSAGCVSEQRRRYNAELKAARKVALPTPGGGEAYSGAKVAKALKRAIEDLFLQGLGTKKINERTGASHTTIQRVRTRLVARLRRKGEALPGCDLKGVRHAQAESARFVPETSKAAFRSLLLDRVPVRRAASLTVIGYSTAGRLRDEFAAELAALGQQLPPPKLPGRVKGGGYAIDPAWPPRGTKAIYEFRALLQDMDFEDAKKHWRRQWREQRQANAARPRSFEEQLERVARGEIGIAPALTRVHLEPAIRPERNVA